MTQISLSPTRTLNLNNQVFRDQVYSLTFLKKIEAVMIIKFVELEDRI